MAMIDNRSVPELFADALNQFSKLMRNEFALARAELSIKAGEAMRAVGLLIGAGLFVIPTIVLLLIALAAWFVELGLPASVSYFIAGVVGLAITAILAAIGSRNLKTNSLVPKRTLDQLQRDVAAAKEHV
jgi:Putative Actinobacterial Holin-X, holin superfamily III